MMTATPPLHARRHSTGRGRSSRTLPGHEYSCSAPSAPTDTGLYAVVGSASERCRTSAGMSSARARSGGTRTRTPLSLCARSQRNRPPFSQSFERFVRCRDQTKIAAPVCARTERTKLPGLHGAQQLGLISERQTPNLIEKERSAVRFGHVARHGTAAPTHPSCQSADCRRTRPATPQRARRRHPVGLRICDLDARRQRFPTQLIAPFSAARLVKWLRRASKSSHPLISARCSTRRCHARHAPPLHAALARETQSQLRATFVRAVKEEARPQKWSGFILLYHLVINPSRFA
jgi:hypothetical protein